MRRLYPDTNKRDMKATHMVWQRGREDVRGGRMSGQGRDIITLIMDDTAKYQEGLQIKGVIDA